MDPGTAASSRAFNRRYYTWAGVLAILVVLTGFAKTYFLKEAFGTPPLRPLLHLHGLVMTSWFLLFIVQARLVAVHRVDLHRKLGMLGAFLALAVIVVGTTAGISGAKLGHTPGPPPLVFLVVPLVDMVVFASLVGAGLWFRSKPDVHRRLMLLSCIGMLPAAVARIPLAFITKGGLPVIFSVAYAVMIAIIAVDAIRARRLHPAFLWGGLFVLLSLPLRIGLGGTHLWMRFAQWVTG